VVPDNTAPVARAWETKADHSLVARQHSATSMALTLVRYSLGG